MRYLKGERAINVDLLGTNWIYLGRVTVIKFHIVKEKSFRCCAAYIKKMDRMSEPMLAFFDEVFMKSKPTQADEKALALFGAYLALVRSLQITDHLDIRLLTSELSQALHRYKSIGENGAADYLEGLVDDIHRMALTPPSSHR